MLEQFEQFEEIDIHNDKVIRIINAGCKEFAQFGKAKASLNKILKSAGISKGVFYHYFEDKETLFNYLLYFSVKLSIEEIDAKLEYENEDLIMRICEVTKRRLDIVKHYPFLMELNDRFRHEIFQIIGEGKYKEVREKFYSEKVDYAKFRDQARIKEAIHIIRWTYKGLGLELLKTYGNDLDDNTIEALKKQCDAYYEVLSTSFYK